jgi:N-acetylmuramoyl-L-alanine amidase
MNEFVFLIDNGHSGVIDGEYLTSPNKMFRFPNGTYSYEGVINRELKRELLLHMDDAGLAYIDICPTELDLGLDERVDIANRLYLQYPKAVYISIHNNASPEHNASGSEVWTTVGQTLSDHHASIYADCFKKAFPKIKFRSDSEDGDVDKESMFYVLKWTRCPAFLVEVLFFDLWQDYMWVTDPVFQSNWAKIMIDYMTRAIKREEIW